MVNYESLSDEEKIEVFNQFLNKTFYDEPLEPVLKDLYDMFYHEFHLLGFVPKNNRSRIGDINRIFLPIFKIIEKNNVELFHDIAQAIAHPKHSSIGSNFVYDIIELLQNPNEYCTRDNNYFRMITECLIEEGNYDLYLKYSNYIYFDYLCKTMDLLKKYNAELDIHDMYIIIYFLINNINPSRFVPILEYKIKNYDYLEEFYVNNFVKEQKDNLWDILVDYVSNQRPIREIK